MTTTITLEFTSATHQHLKDLEYELKQISGTKVFLVEPRDAIAPVLISIGIDKKGEQADLIIRRITHTLYDFMHSSAQEASPQHLPLVTIEGESVDIAPLSFEEIRQLIADAHAGQTF